MRITQAKVSDMMRDDFSNLSERKARLRHRNQGEAGFQGSRAFDVGYWLKADSQERTYTYRNLDYL